MDIKETLFALCRASSTAGDEDFTAPTVMKMLNEYMPAQQDAMGNITGTQKGDGENILLSAHMDSIGMIVTELEKSGFLRVDKCGGVDIRTLAGQDVTVLGKRNVYGVITSTPPHLAKDSENAAGFDEMLVDTGISDERINDIVSLGDRVVFRTQYNSMQNGNVSGAYFDDKAGVCAVLRCLEILREKDCRKKVSVLFSTQEETGSSGAAAGGFGSDAAKCICIDVSFAKAKGTPESVTARLGAGAMIGVAPVLDNGMSSQLMAVAKQRKIPYQTEIMGGSTGTDADKVAVSRGGIKTALISVPLKNMHTPVEVVNLDDIESAAQLMAHYVISNGGVRL